MITKEDYMKLSKERLAELLVERDNKPDPRPYIHIPQEGWLPCYAPNGICTNPQRDCINCPKLGGNWNPFISERFTVTSNSTETEEMIQGPRNKTENHGEK